MATKKPQPRGKILKQKPSTLAKDVFAAHLRQLDRHVRKNGVGGVDGLYDRARAELIDRLRRYKSDDLRADPVSLRAMLGQVEAVMSVIGPDLNRHLTDVSSAAAEMGAVHAVDEFKILQKHFRGTVPVLRLDVPSVFEGLVKGVDSSLLRRHQAQAQAWTLGAVAGVERQLSTSAMTGKGTEKVIDDVKEALKTERWKAERIVRTEMAYGHGASKQETMRETEEELDMKLWKRLVETVANGQGLDDRIGDDSLLLHGQTVRVDEPFTWKKKVRGGWVLEQFMHPPNRPNDRATVIPWDPEWEETDLERPLSISELKSAAPTRWRTKAGVDVPPGHTPGRSYTGR